MKIYKQTDIDILAKILKNNGIISVPTDTVFGICACINSTEAYNKLMSTKNRPQNKLFPIMCSDEKQIKSISEVDENAQKLISEFMPGPITIILNKKIDVFVNNNGFNYTTIGVRMAPTDFLKKLIYKVGKPIFMTSANKSGKQVCKNIKEIEKVFPTLDGIVEGNVVFQEPSTIVDCTLGKIRILREGPISVEQILNL